MNEQARSNTLGEILVVEDTLDSLKLLSDLLAKAGYAVRAAKDGELALMTCAVRPPELVLLDIRMPGLDGYQVCQRLKADPATRDIPVIFLSALHETEDRLRGFREGAVDFISKPFQAEEVLVRVRTHLALAQTRKDLERERSHLEERVRERTAELQQEIAERKRAETALRESEQRFRALFEQAAVGVAQLETHTGQFVRINRRYAEICGYSREEMLAAKFQDITYPEDIEACRANLARLISGEVREYTMEKRYCRKDGSIVWVSLTVSPMWMAGEAPTHHIAVVQDITERVHAEEKLRNLNSTLEQRVQEELSKNRDKDLIMIQQSRLAAMGEMVHNIAHQWRQPLNALAIIITNIKDDYDYGELDAENLGVAVAKSHRLLKQMSTTVDDFRNFFRPEREAGDFTLAKPVQDACFIVEDAFKNNDIELVRELDDSLIANGYPNQFAQAILNLLANAKEAIQHRGIRDGRVEVRLRKRNGEALVTVRDNAGGIDPDVLPRVFDPYYTTKEQGSGIGLYMTKMIIERNMHGSIGITNLPDGVEFELAVPLITPPVAPA